MKTNNETKISSPPKTNNVKSKDKNSKKVKKLSESSKYFDYYDDIKSGCNKVIDW